MSHCSVICAFSPSVSAEGRVSLYKLCGGGNHPFPLLAWEEAISPTLTLKALALGAECHHPTTTLLVLAAECHAVFWVRLNLKPYHERIWPLGFQ